MCSQGVLGSSAHAHLPRPLLSYALVFAGLAHQPVFLVAPGADVLDAEDAERQRAAKLAFLKLDFAGIQPKRAALLWQVSHMPSNVMSAAASSVKPMLDERELSSSFLLQVASTASALACTG